MNEEDRDLNRNEYREFAKWNRVQNPDLMEEEPQRGNAHPSPEELFIREAMSKALMNKQKEVWAMYAYDQMTFAEIGRKLKITESAVRQRIATIERQVKKWCEGHMEVFKAIKEAQGND